MPPLGIAQSSSHMKGQKLRLREFHRSLSDDVQERWKCVVLTQGNTRFSGIPQNEMTYMQKLISGVVRKCPRLRCMMGVLEGSVGNGNLMRWAVKYDHLPVLGDKNLKTDDASHESQKATCKDGNFSNRFLMGGKNRAILGLINLTGFVKILFSDLPKVEVSGTILDVMKCGSKFDISGVTKFCIG
ncbi:hypothetical protein ARMGADRAFT_1038392 [Armillaria gallica]|uniref:Uncharacterized protein n=1 Tax=Armillaria gallica TaxID=47427 RepID=A0A2H3D321_ARMGA|nr:hypothetical protein ARMGADRAFT_1038392 [Armillaria gallica]